MDKRYHVDLPKFTGRNVPITEIAKAIGKDPHYIRYGLQNGIFHFWYAIKIEGSSEYNYYCPDRKVWEELGYYNSMDIEEKKELRV